MITEVKAYSAWNSAPTLPLDVAGRAETDLIQIRNIDGLDPVKASVNTSPYGSIDGGSYIGSNVPSRNIVLTIKANPNWDDWTYESLRKLVYQYFMPKLATRLVFISDDIDPVEISGVVESCENNMFSKDPEILVSIVCPDPYFTAVDPIVLTGQTIDFGDTPAVVAYAGNVETGFKLKVSYAAGSSPLSLAVQMGDLGAPDTSYITIETTVDANKYFEMSTVQMKKYFQSVNVSGGAITNLLSKVGTQQGSMWAKLRPGNNKLSVITFSAGTQDWELSYYARYGGL